MRVALITGAAGGIGRELARVLSADGTAIAALDKSATGLLELETELRSLNRAVACETADVTDFAQTRDAIGRLEARLAPVDLLIANAGIGIETSALKFQAEDMARVIEVNLIGVCNSIAAVLPDMLQRRSGHIVGMSSLASLRGLPRLIGYSASKAGLNALLEGLRVEVKPYNIAVTTICPGWIRTPMTQMLAGKTPLLDLTEAVREMVRAIRRRKRFHAFPRSTAWTLRLLRLLPASVGDGMVARTFQKMRATQVPAQQ